MKMLLLAMVVFSSVSYAQDRPKIIVHDNQSNVEINNPVSPIMQDNFEQVPFGKSSPVFSSPENSNPPVPSIPQEQSKKPKQVVKQPSVETATASTKTEPVPAPAVKQKTPALPKEPALQEKAVVSVQSKQGVNDAPSNEVIISGKRYVLSEAKQDKPVLAEPAPAPVPVPVVMPAVPVVDQATQVPVEQKPEIVSTGKDVETKESLTEAQPITTEKQVLLKETVGPAGSADGVRAVADSPLFAWTSTSSILFFVVILFILAIFFIIKKHRRQESYWF